MASGAAVRECLWMRSLLPTFQSSRDSNQDQQRQQRSYQVDQELYRERVIKSHQCVVRLHRDRQSTEARVHASNELH
jgi:hypothetical protein